MEDMKVEDIVGEYTEHTLSIYPNGERKVYVTDVETPFPEGKLIVSTADLDGVIAECNKAFVFMSGYTKEELVGQPHTIIRHPDMPKATYKHLWDTLKAGERWHGYVKNLRKDGGYYWTYASIIPNIRKGELVGYTSVRRKPSRAKVEEHIKLYKEMRDAEV